VRSAGTREFDRETESTRRVTARNTSLVSTTSARRVSWRHGAALRDLRFAA
jgi:hypothetical protein